MTTGPAGPLRGGDLPRRADQDVATAAWAAAHLRERISDGELAPGAKLSEHAVSAALGISRNTLREAFAQLAAEAIVVRVPHRGVFVAEPTLEDIREVYRTRRALEPAAVLWGEVTAEAIDDLADIARTAETAMRSGEVRVMADANQRLHRGIVGLTGSSTLLAAMDRVLARMRLVFAQMAAVRTFHAGYVPRNLELVSMLRAGERERAATFLHSYLADAEKELVAHRDASRRPPRAELTTGDAARPPVDQASGISNP